MTPLYWEGFQGMGCTYAKMKIFAKRWIFTNASRVAVEAAVTCQPKCIPLAPLGCLLKPYDVFSDGSSFPDFQSQSSRSERLFLISHFFNLFISSNLARADGSGV